MVFSLVGYNRYIEPIKSYNVLKEQQKYIKSTLVNKNFSEEIYNKLIIDDIDYKVEFNGTKLVSNKYQFDDNQEYLLFTSDVLCRLNLSKSCFFGKRIHSESYLEAVNQSAIYVAIIYSKEK